MKVSGESARQGRAPLAGTFQGRISLVPAGSTTLWRVKALIKRRGVLVNGALALILVAGAFVAYLSLRDDAGASSPGGRLVRVSRGTVVSSVSASGSVASAMSRDLTFGTSGTVDSIKVQPGDTVRKGQVLATLDDTAARDTLRSAQAALTAAEAGDTSTAAGYSTYVQAKASYDSAQRALDGTTLTAPFSGTIIMLNGSVGGSSSGSASSATGSSGTGSGGSGGNGGSGANGGPGSGGNSGGGTSGNGGTGNGGSSAGSGGFLTIADTTKLEVRGNFTESDVVKVKKGQHADVTFDAMRGTRATGSVTAIDQTSTTSNNVVQYGVTVMLTHPPAGLRIGATATVRVTVSRADNVLYVPAAAVRTAGGQSTVTVVDKGRQVTRTVRAGVQGDVGTEIKSGLNEGDQVVISTSGIGGTGFPTGRFPGGGGLGGGGGVRIGGRG